ncbi:MAG TPA: HEAT repeat domain-containing protein [Pyrinomonadaceae bacterium]|nr:HEAT repeat domain-containing protein [Pyrinomonadaceae bacterium]
MRPSLHRRTLDALLALASLASPPAPASARAETYWLDGYEVEVTLKPLREPFVLGEPVELVLTFENRSEAAVELLLSGDGGRGRPDDFDVSLTGPDGKPVPRPAPTEEGRGGYSNIFLSVRRDELVAARLMSLTVPLKNWGRFERPGVYKVSLRRGVVAGPYNGKYRLWPETTKHRTELRLETKFIIVEGGDAGVGELIEELGARVLACDQNSSVAATTRLAALEDERAVKPLAEAVAKCKNPSIKYQALQGLAKFSTDAGFEALRAAASDPDEDFRTVAAQAVAHNEHPKASALLLSMRRDSYYGVRLMVLNALEEKDTEAARRLIWQMTHDEHPMVREEALRFLQQRPAPSRP